MNTLILLLSLLDVVPTKAQLVEAGAGQHGEVLAQVAMDQSVPRYARTRAASSLSMFDDEIARASLAALIDDPALDDPEVRIQAIAAYTVLERDRALPKLSLLAADRHPEIRAAAIRAAARLEHPDAKRLLAGRLNLENDAAVRALIERKLKPSEQPPAAQQ
jgi:HEAT repeat protein